MTQKPHHEPTVTDDRRPDGDCLTDRRLCYIAPDVTPDRVLCRQRREPQTGARESAGPVDNAGDGADDAHATAAAEALSLDAPLAPQDMDNAIECVLFCAGTPISLRQILNMFGGDATLKDIKSSVARLKQKYDGAHSGITLAEFSHGIQLRTKPAYANFLQAFLRKRPWRISRQAMEVLAIVAYRQPIHRAAVDEIRGVESSHLLHTLMDKGLVRMAGRIEHLPGKPIGYATTERFLEVFSIETLEALPTLAEIKETLESEPQAL